MKKHVLILTIFICYLSCITFGNAKEPIKILAIGNSFSADALEDHLYDIAKAGGDSLIVANLYIGGASLELHVKNAKENNASYEYRKTVGGIKTNTKNATLLSMLHDEDWDYISLQQVSQNSGLFDTYSPYLEYLIQYVKQNTKGNPKLVSHRTWAYAKKSTHSGFVNYDKDQLKMFNAIVSVGNLVKNSNPDIEFIIPSGTAIQNGRSSFLGDVFCRDGYHLTYTLGRYTASCTWYEKITGKSVVGNTYVPKDMSEIEIKIAQNAAHFAVENPDEVTDMSNCVEKNTVLEENVIF